MNKYEKKATLIIGCKLLLFFLYCLLFYMYTQTIFILTLAFPVIYFLIMEFWCDWEELVCKFKQQEK